MIYNINNVIGIYMSIVLLIYFYDWIFFLELCKKNYATYKITGLVKNWVIGGIWMESLHIFI